MFDIFIICGLDHFFSRIVIRQIPYRFYQFKDLTLQVRLQDAVRGESDMTQLDFLEEKMTSDLNHIMDYV